MDLTYKKTAYFEGKLENPIEIARNTFLPNGFEIIESDESHLEVARHGIPWGRTPNPLKMVSRAIISCDSGQISLQADLNIFKMIILMLLILIGSLTVLFTVLFSTKMNNNIIFTLQFPIMFFMIPLLVLWFKYGTESALDTLMNNMISSANLTASDIVTEKTGSGQLLFTVFIIPVIAGALIILLNLYINGGISGKTIFNQLDEQTISFISEKFKESVNQANQNKISANCHIHYVNSNFVLSKSGLCFFQNRTGKTITAKTQISVTSNPNQKLYYTDGRELNIEFVKDNQRANYFHMYFTPEKPIAVGDSFYYFWSSDYSQKLAFSGSKKATLKMQNHFGPPVIETFFVVLPHKLTLSEKDSPTASSKLDNFDVYWWTKEIPQDGIHTEQATIIKQ